MTDTTTRRGVKPLLALLLTGMALLMMGAVRPVMAATPYGTITVNTQGGVTAPDTLNFFAEVEYSGDDFSVYMTYQYEIVTVYHYRTGVDATVTEALSPLVRTNGVSTISSMSQQPFTYPGGQNALTYMNQHSGVVGFSWHYHIDVNAMINSTGANGGTASGNSITQTYGVQVEPSPPTGPPTRDV